MFFDDEEEKLEEARYEKIQTNIQNLTLTIDVNIVFKYLFKYIKLKCTQKNRIMDILALFLSIFSIILWERVEDVDNWKVLKIAPFFFKSLN